MKNRWTVWGVYLLVFYLFSWIPHLDYFRHGVRLRIFYIVAIAAVLLSPFIYIGVRILRQWRHR